MTHLVEPVCRESSRFRGGTRDDDKPRPRESSASYVPKVTILVGTARKQPLETFSRKLETFPGR